MPDSTSTIHYLGHKDAPVIQFDDKADVTDAYAFFDYEMAGDGNATTSDPFSDSAGIGPVYYNFDDQLAYDINLSESFPVATPANASLPSDTPSPTGASNDAPATRDNPNPAENGIFGTDLFKGFKVEFADIYEEQFYRDLDSVYEDTGSGAPRNGSTGDPADTPGAVSDVPIPVTIPPFPAGNTTGTDEDGPAMDGFPNGSRFGDDVLDIAVTAAISDLRAPADQGGFTGAAAASGSASLGGFPYQISLDPGTTGLGTNLAAGVGEGLADDDPENHGDGELIL